MEARGNFNNKLTNRLENIQSILIEDYPDTKKVMISTERFCNFTNNEVFYSLFNIMDEIFLYLKTNNPKRLILLRSNIIISNILSILISSSEIAAYYSKLYSKKNKEIYERCQKIISILVKNGIIEFDSDDEFIYYEKIKDIDFVSKNLDLMVSINRELIYLYEKLIRIFIDDWSFDEKHWKTPMKVHKNKINDEFTSTFIEFIINEYIEARSVLIDVMYKQGHHYKPAITDIRDAVDHIAKSMIFDPIDSIMELHFASEHIRRAAVESIQSLCETKFKDINSSFEKIKKIPDTCLDNWFKAKESLIYARFNKADPTWYYSVNHFYDALDYLIEIDNIIEKK